MLCYISCVRVFPDPALPTGMDPLPPSLDGSLEFNGVQYRILQKRLDWHAALQVCESVNGTLAAVRDPRQHAYLTLLLSTLRKPAWIALHNDGVSDIVCMLYVSSPDMSELQQKLLVFPGAELHMVGRRGDHF